MNVTPTPALLSVATESGAASPPAWQAGERLTAIVLAQNGPQSLTLRIGGRTVEVNTPLNLAVQSQLQLEVVRSQPALLRIVPSPVGNDVLGTALRAALSQQAPLREIFAALATFTANQAALATLPPPALAALTRLFADLPAATLSPAGLRQALRDSGLVLEQKLTRGGRPEVGPDLKANLLRLLAALDGPEHDESPVQRLATAALARIELHQLGALSQPAAEQAYTIELPLRRDGGVDLMQLRIERDARGHDEQPHGWTVWLNLDLDALGPLQGKVTLRGGTLSAVFWAERSAGAALISDHLAELEGTLRQAGLEVTQLKCLNGAAPHNPFAVLPSGLVDIKA